MAVKKNKEVTKDQAIFMNVNNNTFEFELWPNNYKNETLNHLYMPEFILNIWGEPFVYFIDLFYVLGERILELKAIKLYLASFKNMNFNSYSEVMDKLEKNLVELANPKYLKIVLSDRDFNLETREKGILKDFAFDTYLNSRTSDNLSEICKVTSYNDAIVNFDLSVPVICDIYVLSNKDIKGDFIKTIMKLPKEKLITEEIPKFVLNELKHLDKDLEVIVDFNIRWNIKKIRSVFQWDLTKLRNREVYIEQIIWKFSSYTN